MALDTLKEYKDRFYFQGDIRSATIKIVGKRGDVEDALNKIKEKTSEVRLLTIRLSPSQKIAWEAVLNRFPGGLKGVLKSAINPHCSVTLHHEPGDNEIELAAIPRVLKIGKSIFEDLIRKSSLESFDFSVDAFRNGRLVSETSSGEFDPRAMLSDTLELFDLLRNSYDAELEPLPAFIGLFLLISLSLS